MKRVAQFHMVIVGPSDVSTPYNIPSLVRVMKRLTRSSQLYLLQARGEIVVASDPEVEVIGGT